MKAQDRKNLELAAHQWIIDNEDEIEVYETYIEKDQIPDDVEDLETWLMDSSSDYSTGFTMVKIEAENGVAGMALITVRGSSWEGLRIDLAGVFESGNDARAWIEKDAYIL